MFTGLIEEIGSIESVSPAGGCRRIRVSAKRILEDISIDDSISISGACQTVVSHTNAGFEVEAVEETLRKTTLGSLRGGAPVNLERAMRLGDRLGGHLVQGHVDTTGNVRSIEKQQAGILIWITYPENYARWVVPQGSICIDGVSLTAARVDKSAFMVSIIPHTWKMTTLAGLRPGAAVNLEFDIIGKYIERIASPHLNRGGEPPRGASSLEQFMSQPEF